MTRRPAPERAGSGRATTVAVGRRMPSTDPPTDPTDARPTSAVVGRRGRGGDGSSDVLGLALLAPAAIGLAIVLLFLSRGVDSRATAMSAAESAAQAAARERSPAAARAAADRIAAAMLTDPHTCASPSIAVDLGDFRPGGVVAVTVSCSTSTSGLELVDPPDPGPMVATAYAVVDPLRGVEP